MIIESASLSKQRIPFTLRRQLTHLIVLSLRPDIKDLEIRHEASGRPYLYSSKASVDLPLISISHSGTWIGVILSDPSTYATLDLEDMTLPRSHASLSNNFFSETEKNLVLAQGALGFLKLWTAKEAIAKWQGEGINFVLNVDLGQALQGVVLKQPVQVCIEEKNYTLMQDILEGRLFYTVCQGTTLK
ncbi:MAG: 4'-phosphopantetheinyl transferase superfamily protein [Candidatus Paracaedibacteraceae bacterium]|nr:4'-phosphopantetheinyl transferase superfamily protein [Candidatus Paracaedibacteraceae bacterium]